MDEPKEQQANLPAIDADKGEWDSAALARRHLLAGSFWTIAGVATAGVGGVGTRFLAGDSFDQRRPEWVEIGAIDDLATAGMHRVNYHIRVSDAWRKVQRAGTLFAFRNGGGNFTVLDATCTHLGCVVRWQDDRQRFACPCHAGYFDQEGNVLEGPPPKPLRRLATKVENGVLWAQI